MIQQILAYFLLALAMAYLAHKFILPLPFLAPKKKSVKNCGGSDCGC